MSTWFRVHNDILDNPKLILIAESDRWRYLGLLSLKSQGVLDQFDGDKLDRVVAAKLRLTPAEWAETKRRLLEEDLINDTVQPTGWDDRQFKSDSSAERVRKHRAKKAAAQEGEGVPACNDAVTLQCNGNETLQKRESNGRVTPPDTEDRLQRTDKTKTKTSCAEPAGSAPPAADDSPVVFELKTNRFNTIGQVYPITQRDLDRFADLYPAVDLLQEIRNASGWLDGNAKRRKTMSGTLAFLHSWLAKAQNRGGSMQASRPAGPRQSTRHATLAEDLGDTSWAAPVPAATPAAVAPAAPALRPAAQPAQAPQGGGFKVLPKLQAINADEIGIEDVIVRYGTKLIMAASLGVIDEPAAQSQMRGLLSLHKPGRLLEGVIVGMAGRYTDLGWMDTVTGNAAAIAPDWEPSPASLASLSAAGLPPEVHARSRTAFLSWFRYHEIRCASWDDLFTRMCLVEWARADGSVSQYTQTLAAASAVSQEAWKEPA